MRGAVGSTSAAAPPDPPRFIIVTPLPLLPLVPVRGSACGGLSDGVLVAVAAAVAVAVVVAVVEGPRGVEGAVVMAGGPVGVCRGVV